MTFPHVGTQRDWDFASDVAFGGRDPRDVKAVRDTHPQLHSSFLGTSQLFCFSFGAMDRGLFPNKRCDCCSPRVVLQYLHVAAAAVGSAAQPEVVVVASVHSCGYKQTELEPDVAL